MRSVDIMGFLLFLFLRRGGKSSRWTFSNLCSVLRKDFKNLRRSKRSSNLIRLKESVRFFVCLFVAIDLKVEITFMLSFQTGGRSSWFRNYFASLFPWILMLAIRIDPAMVLVSSPDIKTVYIKEVGRTIGSGDIYVKLDLRSD